MFVKGVDGSGKSDYQMDVKIVQDTSDALLKKVGKDTGIGSEAITALTGLMDFNVTIPDAKNHGKIVSLSWVLPEGTTDPKYLKKDSATGEYFDFKFDSKTGEGAKWDSETSTLTVYVRDNGKNDSDSTAGKVRDPGFISSTSSSKTSTEDAGGSTITGPGGKTTTNTSVSINENSKIVHTFTANETVTWSLRSGADISQFTIDALTGVLSFKTAPDFENPTDSDKNNVYEVVVFSTDSDNDSSNQKLSIIVNDSKNDVKGTIANDSLVGDSYNNEIDGGAGDDTVIFTGNYSNYSFTRNEDSLNISDQRSGTNDGTDTLTNIEYIQFADQTIQQSKVDVVKTYSGNFRDYKFYNKGDGTYEIKSSTGTTDEITGIPKLTFDDKTAGISAITEIKGVFDQVTGKETPSGEMFRLYNAAFARFPDSSGLEYWIDKFSSGVDDARAVASSFLVSDEFKERYGDNVSNAKYVETLYTNVLGRDYDQEGYDYWLGNLNNGIETRYELLLGFAESAENKTLFTEMTGFA
jgi:hypothetical protein